MEENEPIQPEYYNKGESSGFWMFTAFLLFIAVIVMGYIMINSSEGIPEEDLMSCVSNLTLVAGELENCNKIKTDLFIDLNTCLNPNVNITEIDEIGGNETE